MGACLAAVCPVARHADKSKKRSEPGTKCRIDDRELLKVNCTYYIFAEFENGCLYVLTITNGSGFERHQKAAKVSYPESNGRFAAPKAIALLRIRS